jgi:ice-binding like protein
MDTYGSGSKAWMWFMAAVLAAFMAGCGNRDEILGTPGGGGGGPGPAGAAPALGAASSFGIAATAGVTNTPTAPITHIDGDVVLANPSPTCGGAPAPGGAGQAGFGLCGGNAPTLNGTVVTPTFPDATTANNVKAAMNAAFLSITPPAGPPAAGSRGGATNLPAGTTLGAPTGSALVQNDNWFVPGVYQSLTSILITGDLTLDAQGNSNAVFIFQSSSSVGTAPSARILLVNGARASNVFWQAASSATLGTNTVWQGNIFASADITMNTGATSCGRLWAGAWVGGGGAFVFDSNVVSVPGNPSAPAGCQ